MTEVLADQQVENNLIPGQFLPRPVVFRLRLVDLAGSGVGHLSHHQHVRDGALERLEVDAEKLAASGALQVFERRPDQRVPEAKVVI